MNAIRQVLGGSVYGALLAQGGQDPEALITDATLTANSWTRDPSDEDLTLHYANIQSAIDAMPGDKTVADYLVYYQHNNSGTGRAYYQPRVDAILGDLVTAGLIDDTTKIVMVEANPDRSDAIIEAVQDSLTDIASRNYPNAVTVGQGGIPTFDNIHPTGVGCVWLGQRISQALLGGGEVPTQRIVLVDRSNNDLQSLAEINKWNGDNLRLRHTNDQGYIEANWNPQSQTWRVTGTGGTDYMRVESTGIEDTPVGATTPSTGDFTSLTASLNVIMGTTEPWTFAGNWRGIKVTDRHAVQATPNASSIAMSANAAIGVSGWEYTAAAAAGNYTISGNLHLFNRAVAGTDGTAVTFIESWRIDPSGNLLPGANGTINIGSSTRRVQNITTETIESSGNANFGTTNNSPGVGDTDTGHAFNSGGQAYHSRDGGSVLRINRNTDDGKLITFHRDGVEQGDISVLAGTVSLNGAHLTRISQGEVAKDTLRGTVMENASEMCAWGYAEFEVPVLLQEEVEGDEAVEAVEEEWGQKTIRVPYYGKLPEGAELQVEREGSDYTATVFWEENQHLNKMQVSADAGSRNVAGVFETFDLDDLDYPDDFKVAQSGDYVIRTSKDASPAMGDLLESAGDGTARPQTDDLIRSSTIAKITSTEVVEIYPDGSYTLPCVLMVC